MELISEIELYKYQLEQILQTARMVSTTARSIIYTLVKFAFI
jgi:hypothetical protein